MPILAVLMIVAAGVLLASTISLISIGEIQSSLSLSTGEGTLGFVEGCAEDALLKARASMAYAGGTVTRPEGTCSVTASHVGTADSSTWTVTATTQATTYVRTVQVIFVRGINGITITSWQET